MDEAGKLIHQKEFASFVDILGAEIEQAQIKLVSAANIQLLLHYWKIGHFIIYNQNRLGWGSKIIEKTANAIKTKYPNKKGYSSRNLVYMCQFAKQYPLEILRRLTTADMEME